jgi:hypothetical protein
MKFKIILLYIFIYVNFVFSYICKCKYNDNPFEYCCYEEVKEVQYFSSLNNDKNLAFLYNLILITNFIKDPEAEPEPNPKSDYEEIEKSINGIIYNVKELLELNGQIHNRIIDSKLLNVDEKLKLQNLRISKKGYFDYIDEYGKVSDNLQDILLLRKNIESDRVLVDLHKNQILEILDRRINILQRELDDA